MPAIVHLTDTFNVYSFIAEKCWTRAIMRRTCRFICSVRLLLLPSQQPFFPFLLGNTQATTGYGNEILMKSSGSRKTAPSSGCGWARGHACARGRTPAGPPWARAAGQQVCLARAAGRREGVLGVREKLLCTCACESIAFCKGLACYWL